MAGAAALVLVLIGGVVTLITADTAEDADLSQTGLHEPTAQIHLHQKAKQGDAQAQFDLGRAHWKNAEYPQAFPWFKAAAERGHIEAEYMLGMAYLSGRGTLQNYRAALDQFIQAAKHGHLEAEYRLGLLYRDGLATPPDKETAYLWLNIAAARGHEEALQYRDKLADVMSAEEIDRAQEASTQAHAKLIETLAGKP